MSKRFELESSIAEDIRELKRTQPSKDQDVLVF